MASSFQSHQFVKCQAVHLLTRHIRAAKARLKEHNFRAFCYLDLRASCCTFREDPTNKDRHGQSQLATPSRVPLTGAVTLGVWGLGSQYSRYGLDRDELRADYWGKSLAL